MATPAPTEQMEQRIRVSTERDIIAARSAGRDLCRQLGFRPTDQVKVATAISELARNIVRYAQEGAIVLRPCRGRRRGIEVVAHDSGPGIPNLEAILAGRHKSRRGLGLGLIGTKRLMDDFEVATDSDRGTTLIVRKYLP